MAYTRDFDKVYRISEVVSVKARKNVGGSKIISYICSNNQKTRL